VQDDYFVVDIEILPEWIDDNGHFHDACYTDVFSSCFGELLEGLGVGRELHEHQGLGMFSLQSNITYFREVLEGEVVRVQAQLVDADTKKLHLYAGLYRKTSGELCATNERLLIHVDLASRKSRAFAPPIQQRVDALLASHRSLPRPQSIGATIKIARPAQA